MPSRFCSAYAVILSLLLAAPAASAATSTIEVDHTVTIPDIVSHNLIADGEGDDWTGAVLRVDLTAGSVYNSPVTDPDDPGYAPCPGICIPFLPGQLEGDTYVGIINDGSAGIAGGAGDLGCGAQSISGTGECAISIIWFNTNVGDTSPVKTGNISLTDDAAGTWVMIMSFAGGQVHTSGPVINGVMVPEPASLSLLCAFGLALLKRGR